MILTKESHPKLYECLRIMFLNNYGTLCILKEEIVITMSVEKADKMERNLDRLTEEESALFIDGDAPAGFDGDFEELIEQYSLQEENKFLNDVFEGEYGSDIIMQGKEE